MSRPDAEGEQSKDQGVSPGGAGNRLATVAERTERRLELFDLGPVHIPPMIQDPTEGRLKEWSQPDLLCGKPDMIESLGRSHGFTVRDSQSATEKPCDAQQGGGQGQ